jgi:hypothetical protein
MDTDDETPTTPGRAIWAAAGRRSIDPAAWAVSLHSRLSTAEQEALTPEQLWHYVQVVLSREGWMDRPGADAALARAAVTEIEERPDPASIPPGGLPESVRLFHMQDAEVRAHSSLGELWADVQKIRGRLRPGVHLSDQELLDRVAEEPIAGVPPEAHRLHRLLDVIDQEYITVEALWRAVEAVRPHVYRSEDTSDGALVHAAVDKLLGDCGDWASLKGLTVTRITHEEVRVTGPMAETQIGVPRPEEREPDQWQVRIETLDLISGRVLDQMMRPRPSRGAPVGSTDHRPFADIPAAYAFTTKSYEDPRFADEGAQGSAANHSRVHQPEPGWEPFASFPVPDRFAVVILYRRRVPRGEG